MDKREIIAYAVDADTGKVIWRLYDEPWWSGKESKLRTIKMELSREKI